MPRRVRCTTLSAAELDRFIAAACALHRACCGPLLQVGSPQQQVLSSLNAQLVAAIEAVTGQPAPWTRTPSNAHQAGLAWSGSRGDQA